jgi:hypothetical protein
MPPNGIRLAVIAAQDNSLLAGANWTFRKPRVEQTMMTETIVAQRDSADRCGYPPGPTRRGDLL